MIIHLVGKTNEIKSFKKTLHKKYEITPSHSAPVLFLKNDECDEEIISCHFEIEGELSE